MRKLQAYRFFTLLAIIPIGVVYGQDSTGTLKTVTVKGVKKKNHFTSILPAQSLGKEALKQLNAPTVGDAARFFSGVQVKDYGGVGGLKTVSVRSLGSAHTGVLYDGLPVSDVQSGQIDLSRYSSTFLQSIELYQANPSEVLLPAKAFASAAVLSLRSPAYYPAISKQNTWQAGLGQGSFGYWQGFGGAGFVLPRNTTLHVFAEGISSKGDYPFTIENGNLSEKTRRKNGELRSIQGEANLTKLFRDSSQLQIKAWSYISKRGLPGVVAFINDRYLQKLYNRDYFAQLRYVTQFSTGTSLLLSGKFNHSYTRYKDPDFLNNTGGLDDRYKQNEGYVSVSVSQSLGSRWTAGLASDASYTKLLANKTNFAAPSRWGLWSNALIGYSDSLWRVQASLLWSHFSDKTRTGAMAGEKDKFTPTFIVSRTIHNGSPLSVRAFYKEVFRMPTFNDLYYNFIGNVNLRPELARQYNLGVVYSRQFKRKLRLLNLSVDGYINRVKDKIIAVPAQNLFSWTMLNLGKVDIKGVDVTAEANGIINKNLHWQGRIAYTYQQARDITDPSGSKYKNRIPYTPDHSGSGLLSAGYKQWDAGYSVVFSGTRYVLGENNPYNQLDGWGTHDVFISRNFAFREVRCTVKAEVNNITNEHYDIVRYFPMPGRGYKIGILLNRK